jgi:predicted nucleic acid-binding protein
MKTLLDTNVLVYAHDSTSTYQRSAAELVRKALSGQFEAVLSIQNIGELYSVLTSRKRVKKPLVPREARNICKLYLDAAEISKLNPDEKALVRALELASEENIVGGDFFDCLLAATMESAGIKKIYTENISDFEKFGFLEVVSPFETDQSTMESSKKKVT